MGINVTDKKEKRNNQISDLGNHFLVFFLKGISLLPFWMIYGISDLFYFLIKHVFKYRYSVTTQNLTHAFPEKSKDEIKILRDKFYRHFCDFTLESIKMHSMSQKEMDKRIKFKGIDQAEKFYNEGKGLIVLAFHHNNWEWCSSIQPKLKHKVLMVYNPLRNNKPAEDFIIHSRTKWGGEVVPVNKTARAVIEYTRKGMPTILWLAADQTAPANSKFWTLFLNREASFFSGPEKIGIKTNQPIFFQNVRKIGRGKYEAEFSLLIEEPKNIDPNEILLRYIRKMEEEIRKEPEYYLWSHRRWKHTRPDGIPLTV